MFTSHYKHALPADAQNYVVSVNTKPNAKGQHQRAKAPADTLAKSEAALTGVKTV